MSKLLEGKFALVLGIANKWSLAYAIAQAFSREGATLALTYLGDRQKESIEELAREMNVAAVLPCDVTMDEDSPR
jgi:enoyl-[acyl-carrier protein] reductase I